MQSSICFCRCPETVKISSPSSLSPSFLSLSLSGFPPFFTPRKEREKKRKKQEEKERKRERNKKRKRGGRERKREKEKERRRKRKKEKEEREKIRGVKNGRKPVEMITILSTNESKQILTMTELWKRITCNFLSFFFSLLLSLSFFFSLSLSSSLSFFFFFSLSFSLSLFL